MTAADGARNSQGSSDVGVQVKVGGDVFVVGDVARVGSGGGPALQLEVLGVTNRRNGHTIGDRDTVGEFEGGVLAAKGNRARTEGTVAAGDDYAAGGIDGDAAAKGVTACQRQCAGRGLGKTSSKINVRDIRERAAREGRRGKIADGGTRTADLKATHIQDAAVEIEYRSARAYDRTTDDIASDGERTAGEVNRSRSRTQRRRGVAELNRCAGIGRHGDRTPGDSERTRGQGRGAGVDADLHRGGDGVEDRDTRAAERHGGRGTAAEGGLVAEQQVIGVKRTGIEGERRRGRATRGTGTLGELHHIEAQICRVANHIESTSNICRSRKAGKRKVKVCPAVDCIGLATNLHSSRTAIKIEET